MTATLPRLIFEFFKVGLFSIGGGLATIPFLADMGERTGWFTTQELMNMLAVSESTPGPIGINTATYVGYTSMGLPGAVIATLSEVAPAVIIIFIIARMLEKFRTNRYVDYAFYGLRAASAALIGSAFLEILAEVAIAEGSGTKLNWKPVVLMFALFLLTNKSHFLKRLHPIFFVAFSALVGVVFGFAG